MALRTIATAATILCVVLPMRAHAQSAAKTECNDGTRTTATGTSACDGHGGIHHVHSTILHRAPSGTQTQTREPARVSQAGTPGTASRDGQRAEPEEHHGWRWFHRHNDRDDNRRAEERRGDDERRRAEDRRRRDDDRRVAERREQKRDRVRCRDGKYEDAHPNHGRGKGPDVCKHHGGLTH